MWEQLLSSDKYKPGSIDKHSDKGQLVWDNQDVLHVIH